MHLIIQAPFLKMYADYENRYETALSIYTNFMKDQAFGNKVRVSKAKPSQGRPFIFKFLFFFLTPIHVTNSVVFRLIGVGRACRHTRGGLFDHAHPAYPPIQAAARGHGQTHPAGAPRPQPPQAGSRQGMSNSHSLPASSRAGLSSAHDRFFVVVCATQVDDVAVKIDKGLHEYEKQQRLLEISTQSTFVRTKPTCGERPAPLDHLA